MVRAFTTNPAGLLAAVRKAIKEEEITAWRESSHGAFTRTSLPWINKAWFRPSIDERSIKFNIIRPKGGNVSKEVYAVYHGRFSEMLLANFDAELSEVRITALAASGDII